jgi:hypothetical protein
LAVTHLEDRCFAGVVVDQADIAVVARPRHDALPIGRRSRRGKLAATSAASSAAHGGMM